MTHSIVFYVSLGAATLLVMYFIVIFNNLVGLKNNAKKAFSNIGVLLKQRHDELPKLIDTCQQYMQYEQETLTKITQARAKSMQALAQGNIPDIGKAETLLRSSLGNLFALAENYPDLKTNQTFVHLQERISSLENTIADRRELYNDSVTLNNIRLEQFPDLIVGKLFGFKILDVLDYSPSETADISVSGSFRK